MNDRTERFLRDALAEALALQQDLTGKQLSTFRTSRSLQRIAERSLEVIGD